MRVEASSETGLGSLLGSLGPELFSKITIHAGIKDPRVDVLQADATNDQRREVMAGRAYHVIIDSEEEQQYRIGFCHVDAGGYPQYITQPINCESKDAASSLFILIRDYRDLLVDKEHQGRHRLALKYVEAVIKANGGLMQHRLQNRIKLAITCKSLRVILDSACPDPTKHLFQKTIRYEIFADLLHHVAYGEVEEAEQILKHFPEMLLSKWKGNVEDHSQHKVYQQVTAFQMAMRTGCKSMCEMMRDIVNETVLEEQREAYRADLREQVPENPVEDLRLDYQLDALDAAGLRVIEAGDLARFPLEWLYARDDEYGRHAYYLLVDRAAAGLIINPRLVFRSEDGLYNEYPLAADSPHEAVRAFHAFVCDPDKAGCFEREGYPHKVVHNREVKALVRLAIEALGGVTRVNERKTFKEGCEGLSRAFQRNIELRTQPFDYDLCMEHWCVIVGAMQRLMPKSFWEYYLSDKFPWSLNIQLKDFAYVPARDLTVCAGCKLVPFQVRFSDIRAWGVRRMWEWTPTRHHAREVGCFLSSFLSHTQTSYQVLCRQLQTGSKASLGATP